MTSRGFIFGKFLPPHRGHVFLCDTALAMADELIIMVCSTDGEEIAGDLRAAWMRKLAPGAIIDHFHNDLPQTPDDHPQYWSIWADAIKTRHGASFDYAFAGDTYLFDLARAIGASPVLIDPKREIFPISATKLRADPVAAWAMVPAPVRAYYQKRICLLGPESVGKTRLASDLGAHFNTGVMPEYGRDYDVYYMQSTHEKGADWKGENLVALAKTHRAMRAAMRGDAGALLIEDTDAVQTAIWARFLIGVVPRVLAEIEAACVADHYLLLAPDVGWNDDGVRYAGDEKTRAFFFEEAVRRLDTLGASYDVISGGDWRNRRRRAISVIEDKFANQVGGRGQSSR
ncbi:MAG: AAA family ATPase [Parvularculaceae bacterium]